MKYRTPRNPISKKKRQYMTDIIFHMAAETLQTFDPAADGLAVFVFGNTDKYPSDFAFHMVSYGDVDLTRSMQKVIAKSFRKGPVEKK